MLRAVLLALAACTDVKSAAGEVGGTVAEWIACPTDLIDCGHVYACAAESDTPSGHIEICVNDDDLPEDLDAVEALYGPCDLTSRHQGLCIWCPEKSGCNAFNGCYGCPS